MRYEITENVVICNCCGDRINGKPGTSEDPIAKVTPVIMAREVEYYIGFNNKLLVREYHWDVCGPCWEIIMKDFKHKPTVVHND